MASNILSLLALGFVGSVTASYPRLLQRDTAPNSKPSCFNPTYPIYQDNYDCPSQNPNQIKLNPDGSCGKMSGDTGAGAPCTQYCEVKLSWSFGPEIAFSHNCQADDPACSITSTEGVSVTNTHSFDVGFSIGKRDKMLVAREEGGTSPLDLIKAAFNFGSSWSYSETSSSATSATSTKPKNAAGQCGFLLWAFIPYYITSCGSLTYAPYTPATNVPTGGGTNIFTPGKCGNPKTVGNFCQTSPYTDSNGKAQGETIFVAQDCNSRKPLAFCYQQQPYLQLGVSKTPDMFINYLLAHSDADVFHRDITGPALKANVDKCFNDQWTGPFPQDPSWVNDGIEHAAIPPPGVESKQVAKGV